jgi:thioredoxin-dependent peroxiredoxin
MPVVPFSSADDDGAMSSITFKSTPVSTIGELPAPGSSLPAFELVGQDLAPLRSEDLAGRRVVLNIFPSLDTGTCAMSVRTFNELAAGLENTVVVCVSEDLPFAQARFCGAEGLENVVTGSAFRSSFGEDFGVTMHDGPLAGLLSRAVIVTDETGTIIHTEQVPEVSEEPDYEAAQAALA